MGGDKTSRNNCVVLKRENCLSDPILVKKKDCNWGIQQSKLMIILVGCVSVILDAIERLLGQKSAKRQREITKRAL